MAAGVQGCPAAKGAMGCTAAKGWMGCATPTCQCGPCELAVGDTIDMLLPTFEATGALGNNCAPDFMPNIDMITALLAKLAQLPANITVTVTNVDNCNAEIGLTYTGGGLIDGNAPNVIGDGGESIQVMWSGTDTVEDCPDYTIEWCIEFGMDVVCEEGTITFDAFVTGSYFVDAGPSGGPCGNGSCLISVGALIAFVSVEDCAEPTPFTWSSSGVASRCNGQQTGELGLDSDTGSITFS